MANAVDRAPLGPARCALTLVAVMRRLEWLEARIAYLDGLPAVLWMPFRAEYLAIVTEAASLHCAAALLEAALRWQFESLHTAALETWAT